MKSYPYQPNDVAHLLQVLQVGRVVVRIKHRQGRLTRAHEVHVDRHNSGSSHFVELWFCLDLLKLMRTRSRT